MSAEPPPLFATLLTPAGRGAVATVCVEGKGADDLARRLLFGRDGRQLSSNRDSSVRVAHFASPAGEEVVVRRASSEHIEIHCHGGAAAARAVLDALALAGAKVDEWPNWLARHEGNTIAAEAAVALASATTRRTAGVLLDQHAGALARNVDEIQAIIADGGAEAALAELRRLIAAFSIGRHLTRPFRVVLAGQANVGKSSLINRLLGYERAIVFETPGTTRDVVRGVTAIAGWPVELADTAGLRETQDAIEAEGISRAAATLASADLGLLVFDAARPWTEDERRQLDRRRDALVVFNKSDIASPQFMPDVAGHWTSAVNARGIEELMMAISRRLVPNPPEAGAAIPFTDRQHSHLTRAASALASGAPVAAKLELSRLVG